MRPCRALTTLAVAAVTACSGSTSTPSATPSPTLTATTPTTVAAPCGWRDPKPVKHVIWIWMENRSYDDLLKTAGQAPRLSSYARACGLATDYEAITHPSLPNYLAATSGSTGGVTTDCAPTACLQNRTSLFAQLDDAGLEWRTYAEAMPSPCNTTSQGRYATKHNPAVYFPSIRTRCRQWDLPMSALNLNKPLAAFTFIEPDLCDDGHDCSTRFADAWLGAVLDRITHARAYRQGDVAIFVTWDEGVGADQHIATVVVSPGVPRGTLDAAPYTHYSLLRTTETLLGRTPLGNAKTAPDMSAAFGLRR